MLSLKGSGLAIADGSTEGLGLRLLFCDCEKKVKHSAQE